jgi:selenide,water dikinase
MQVLHQLPKFDDPNLLVGYDSVEDAGVYALVGDLAIAQTVDVLTPIADDPYVFGQIAAANSLSDVYAMGAKPITALNIIGFPAKLDLSILEQIINGGASKVKEAGAVILGGHTIKDEELKYGLAVTGIIDKNKIITNDKARPGNKLILTKPLGTGVISTALKAGLASESAIDEINKSMSELNRKASEVMQKIGVNACTDVTGFGLLGHAFEMAQSSGVGLKIYSNELPFFDEARDHAAKGLFPGGSKSNFDFIKPYLEAVSSISQNMQMLLCDAQTSGGLLICVEQEKSEDLVNALHSEDIAHAKIIGEVVKSDKPKIYVV